MIRTEYRSWHPVPWEEDEQHIECVTHESQCVCRETQGSEAMIVQKTNQLREMLRVDSSVPKPSLGRLQVSMEECRRYFIVWVHLMIVVLDCFQYSLHS